MSGLPCSICGGTLESHPPRFWCPQCGSVIENRGTKKEIARVPAWSEPDQLADHFNQIQRQREQLQSIAGELREAKDGLATDSVRVMCRLMANNGAWFDRLITVLQELAGYEAFQLTDPPADPRAGLCKFGTDDPLQMSSEQLRTTAAYLLVCCHEEDAQAYYDAADAIAELESSQS